MPLVINKLRRLVAGIIMLSSPILPLLASDDAKEDEHHFVNPPLVEIDPNDGGGGQPLVDHFRWAIRKQPGTRSHSSCVLGVNGNLLGENVKYFIASEKVTDGNGRDRKSTRLNSSH